MSATLEELWDGVETAAPDNPAPLLVAADAADEEDKPELAYALRWCAGHKKRPHKRLGISRFPWRWIRHQGYYRTISRKAVGLLSFAILPQPVFDAMPNWKSGEWCADLRGSTYAYDFLAVALVNLREVVEVPSIVLPPAPVVVRTDPMTCAACGILRARHVEVCPVCKSNEAA